MYSMYAAPQIKPYKFRKWQEKGKKEKFLEFPDIYIQDILFHVLTHDLNGT